MSVRAMTWAWEQDLKPGPKFVLVAVADHSDGSGVCWPGHELIAEKCGLSRQTVVEHIAMLEREGFITSERTRNAKGREGKARYSLVLDRLSKQPPESGLPTLARVGISEDPESGFPGPYKDEPKAIEPKPSNPLLFELSRKDIEAWFERSFWHKYPKPYGKAKALSAVIGMKPDQVLLDELAAGLEHRLAAEAHAKASGQWFRAWPDAHRWLKPKDHEWRERFDVPRETLRVDYRCAKCGGAGVVSHGKSWFCRSHDPMKQPTEGQHGVSA